MTSIIVIGKDKHLKIIKAVNNHGISLFCNNKLAYWVNENNIFLLKRPTLYNLMGFKLSPVAMAFENETNLLNPITEATTDYILDDKADELANQLEDKIAGFIMQDSEKNPLKASYTEKYIGALLIIFGLAVLILAIMVGIPYITNYFNNGL
tara:strand:- start:6501 stop:6956 length:456 start_codon:yes stop_codon:yes gene_type:complete